jgi:hypothetical protein
MRLRPGVLRPLTVLALAFAVVVPQLVGVVSAAGAGTFYLSLRPGQCAISTAASGEHPLVVPCSDAHHNMEVYVVTHGGWGATPPASSIINRDARRICLSDFQRLFGGAMRTNFGYMFFFPDPGAQTQQYRDRLICSLTKWPNDHAAMGAGKHFHTAAT